MILQKFIVHIDRKRFLLEAMLQPTKMDGVESSSVAQSAPGQGNQSAVSGSEKTLAQSRIRQEWLLGDGPYYELAEGREWASYQLNQEFISPLKEAVVGSGSLARGLKENKDWCTVEKVSIRIHPKFIDVLLKSANAPDIFLRYSWDEFSQLRTPQVIAGSIENMPPTLLESIKKGCFGRFGLLSRSMYNASKKEDPIDDMGALRWA